MKKGIIAVALLLALSTWACQSKINPTPGETTVVQGCLGGASGGYVLTDDQGNKYVLSGQASALQGLVGQQVLIRGAKVTSAQAPGAPPAAGDQGVQTRIEVTSVKSVSQACAAGPKTQGQNAPGGESR